MFTYKGIHKRTIDGDTVVVDIDLGFYVWLRDIHLRLSEIDTPERGEPGFNEAKEFTDNWMKNNPGFTMMILGKDKYGRWLAEIFCPEESLNKSLLNEGLAKLYI